MPLDPLIIRMLYILFARNAKGPFTNRKIGFDIFAKVAHPCIIAFCRNFIAVWPENNKVRFG